MRKIFVSLLTLLLALPATSYAGSHAAPQYITKTPVIAGEKWWGVFVSDAPLSPFLTPFKVNTADSPASGIYTPIMLSSNGRYIWSANPLQIEFDGREITIGSDHEEVKAVKAGKTLREAYIVCCHKNFPPSGQIPDMDLFTMPIYETELELGYGQSQQEILDYAYKIATEGLPKGIIVIPDGWRSASGWYGFDSELYPDPKALVDELHKAGFKVMLTVTPYIPAAGKQYVWAQKQGYMLKGKDGSPKTFTTHDKCHLACYDVGDYEQYNIIREGFKQIRDDIPFDGYRFDCSAAMKLLTDGRKPGFMANWMKLGEGISMCDYMPGSSRQLAPYINTIALGAGYGWEKMGTVINDMVSAGLTGFPYSYVSVFLRNSELALNDDTLMAAFLQLAVSMPVAKVEFAPWRINDPAVYSAVREAIKMRASMGNYIKELVTESAKTAEPMLRHMEYQFPKMGFADCNDQFMLGSRYLFAPNLDGRSKRLVRLPKGVWTDSGGRRFKGPVVTEVSNPDGRIIWFELTSNK